MKNRVYYVAGPTLKLKRPAVLQMYEKTVESFYAEGGD